jgi:cell division transport system permease protein
VFFSLSNNLQHIARQLSENMVVAFFIDPAAAEADVKEAENRIRSSTSVVRLSAISREEALERFRKNFPELEEVLRNLSANPFPASLEATLSKDAFMSEATPAWIAGIKELPAVQDVQFNRDWVEKMQSLSRLAKAIGSLLGGILILASFFIISNVIRLNVFSRKGEIDILRLVGATNTFIRLPFLIEGISLGILGSLMSLALLYLLVRLFPLYLGQSLGALQEMIAFRYLSLPQSLSLIAGSAVMGLLGSVSSLARFLKI